jgi:hypothetical protein
MKITKERLQAAHACAGQLAEWAHLWPNGHEPTIENLTITAAHGIDAWWMVHLLPPEGPGSRRAYALWCAERVVYLSIDPRVAECLAVVARRVADPSSITDKELEAAEAAVEAAAWAAVEAAAGAARAAVEAAAEAAAEAAVEAARAAAEAAAEAAVEAAEAAVEAAAWAAEQQAQLACLAQLLMEAE